MQKRSEVVKSVILFLSVMIIASLSIAALGGLIEAIPLIYFWYLALFGIIAMLGLTLLLAISILFSGLNRCYCRAFKSKDGDNSGENPHHTSQQKTDSKHTIRCHNKTLSLHKLWTA
jgi:hypothetical protein